MPLAATKACPRANETLPCFYANHWLRGTVSIEIQHLWPHSVPMETRWTIWRSNAVTPLSWYRIFRAVWKHCRDLTRSSGKHTSVTRSRWINHHDLTVAIVTDHNDLNGFTAFLFEALNCNRTTTIKTLVKKQKPCVLKVRGFHIHFLPTRLE